MDTLTYIIFYLAIILAVGIMLAILIKSKNRATEIDEITESGGSASPLQMAAREAVSNQMMQKGLRYGLVVLISVLGVSFAHLWKWWAKPLKIIITFLLALVAVVYFAVKWFYHESGEIVIDVRDFSEIIVGSKIDGIPIYISAVDKNSSELDEIPDVKFDTEDDKKPGYGHTLVRTNEDGLAYVKYSGGFETKDFALRIRAKPEELKNNVFVNDSLPIDTTYKEQYFKVFRLERKREMVQGTIPIDLSAGDLGSDLMNPPPETVDLVVYIENWKGKNSTNCPPPFISSDSQLADTNKFELDGTSFVLREQAINKPFYLTYIVEDGSEVKIKFNVEEDKAGKFAFDPKEKVIKASKGGSPPAPISSTVASSDSCCGPAQFVVLLVNRIGRVLPRKDLTIYSRDGFSEEFTTGVDGKIIFPEEPIPDLCFFWRGNRIFRIIMDRDTPTDETNELMLKRPGCSDDGTRTIIYDSNTKKIAWQ